ncbi:MAG: hypothetical protein ACOX0A_10095 [Thermoguttaceae bacterium]|jgi:hypothetical protein
MKRLVQYFIGSSLVFLMIMSVFNLALFLQAVQCAESGLAGLNGSIFSDELYARLWRAFAVIGVLFIAHFAASAVLAAVYWVCWRPAKKKSAEADGANEDETTDSSASLDEILGSSRSLSPFFAVVFALIVLSPILARGIGKIYGELSEFLDAMITQPLVNVATQQYDNAAVSGSLPELPNDAPQDMTPPEGDATIEE